MKNFKRKIDAVYNYNGFTMIELLAVLVILGILMSIAVISYSSYQKRAKDNSISIAENSISSSVSNFFVNCNTNFNGKNQEICNRYKVPDEVNASTKVWLVDLINDSLMEPITNPYNQNQKCNQDTSYVLVTNKGGSDKNIDLDYLVCLDCGTSYKSNNAKCEWTFSAPTSDKIYPVINSVLVTSKDPDYNSNNVVVKVDAVDNESGIKDMCISQTNFGECSWEAYKTEKDVTLTSALDGLEKSIYVTVRDQAGNYTETKALYTPYKECSEKEVIQGTLGTCSKSCGGGVASREDTYKDKYTSKVCEVKQIEEACNVMDCCSSTKADNPAYGSCNIICGTGGTQTRNVTYRSTYDNSVCKTETQSRSCNAAVSCTTNLEFDVATDQTNYFNVNYYDEKYPGYDLIFKVVDSNAYGYTAHFDNSISMTMKKNQTTGINDVSFRLGLWPVHRCNYATAWCQADLQSLNFIVRLSDGSYLKFFPKHHYSCTPGTYYDEYSGVNRRYYCNSTDWGTYLPNPSYRNNFVVYNSQANSYTNLGTEVTDGYHVYNIKVSNGTLTLTDDASHTFSVSLGTRKVYRIDFYPLDMWWGNDAYFKLDYFRYTINQK